MQKTRTSPRETYRNQKTRLDSVWEWLRPFCSQPQVGSLKEPKPVVVQ